MSATHSRDRITTGEKFHYLTVLGLARTASGRAGRLCRCVCGREIVTTSTRLRSGESKSCGCRSNEWRTKHGHSSVNGTRVPTPMYRVWRAMIDRCTQKSYRGYHRYGGRGIKVCDRWSGDDGYKNFLADMGERPSGTSIDRVNNDGNYEPSNCRWATAAEQSMNRSSNTLLEYDGRVQPLAAWAREFRIQSGTLIARLRNGWPLEVALNRPVQQRRKSNNKSG